MGKGIEFYPTEMSLKILEANIKSFPSKSALVNNAILQYESTKELKLDIQQMKSDIRAIRMLLERQQIEEERESNETFEIEELPME